VQPPQPELRRNRASHREPPPDTNSNRASRIRMCGQPPPAVRRARPRQKKSDSVTAFCSHKRVECLVRPASAANINIRNPLYFRRHL
jgi:hypothetical protein